MKTKRVRPVLVEIKDASNIFENNDKTLSFYEHKQHASSGGKKFELILISLEDEKIEVGNEYLDDCGLIRKAVTSDEDYWKRRPDYKKVIARQSQISPEYISKFIEQYNNDCVEDLEIEMEELYIYPDGTKSKISRLMPDAKPVEEPNLTNGFITIVEKEPISYTEEEVRKLISEALYHFCPMNNHREEDEIDWFENNKKK